ncbi:MAG: Maf family protein [Myxococcota bacterium]
MTNLLLASASPRRRQLLALLGLPFEVAVANVAEVPRTDESPAELVVRLGQAKAQAVVTHSDTVVIACDTVVALDGEILGKPRDATEAALMERLGVRVRVVEGDPRNLKVTVPADLPLARAWLREDPGEEGA